MVRLITARMLGARTVLLEAGSEPHEGKVAVAEVIRNRTLLQLLSDGTVEDTVFKPMQFSCWNGDSRRRGWALMLPEDDPAMIECYTAWDEALSEDSNLTKAATHYLNIGLVLKVVGVLPSWAAMPFDRRQVRPDLVTAKIGQHTFLKLKG